MALLYLSLFAAASAGTLADDVLDRRLGRALVTALAHALGFLAVLRWAMPQTGYQVAGPALLCMLGCAWDLWSSFGGFTRREACCEARESEALGAAVMFGARVPAYACGALLAMGATV